MQGRARDTHPTLIEDSKNVTALDTALDATSSGSPVHCSAPVAEPPQQGNWATVWWHSLGSKHRSSVPIKTLNRFSTQWLTHWETWWIVRSVKIETAPTIVQCLPGARVSDILANLKVLANAKRKFSKIATNDVQPRQLEIIKNNIKEVCELASMMWHCNMLWSPPCLP